MLEAGDTYIRNPQAADKPEDSMYITDSLTLNPKPCSAELGNMQVSVSTMRFLPNKQHL